MNEKKTFNKPEQRKKILDVALKLFYEKGFKDTYLRDIAKECGITKPLISYYFDSKSTLGSEVLYKYVNDNKNRIALKFYNYLNERQEKYDLQVSTALEIKLLSRLYIEDEKALRFVKELADSNQSASSSDEYYKLYKIHKRRYRLDIDDIELHMIAYVISSSSLSLTLAFFEGKLDCTYDQMIDYMVSLNFELMGIDKMRIEDIQKKSDLIIEEMTFEVLPYFQIV